MAARSLVIRGNLPVERLVPEARSAEEPNRRPGTRQLGIPVARSAAGTLRIMRAVKRRLHPLVLLLFPFYSCTQI